MILIQYLGFGGHGSVTGALSSKAFETATSGTSSGNGMGYVGGSSSSKGLTFKEVLATLVLITRGTHEEKIKCELNYDKFIPSRLASRVNFVQFIPKMN